MTDAARPISFFRLSLRELLAAFAVLAIACGALKFATPAWVTALSLAALLAFIAATIVAVVDRGSSQAFGAGFAIAFAVYAVLIYSMSQQINNSAIWQMHNPEFDPYEGALPTSRLLRPVFDAIVEVWNVDMRSGELLKKLSPGVYGGRGFVATNSMYEVPRRRDFAAVGHCLWALLLGYLGGRFGRYVYARRVRTAQPAPPATAGSIGA